MGNWLSGLFSSYKKVSVSMCGLDAVGKTSILYKLKFGEVVTTMPTIGFNVETVRHNNVEFTLWDMGGGDKLRAVLWKFYPSPHGIIWVVDCCDRQRISECRELLEPWLTTETMRDAVLLVYANKQDLPNAMSATEVTEKLELRSLVNRVWHVQPCSAVTGDGLREGLEWLSANIKCLKD